ncbi:hypothetical protein KCP73_16695 [Salmonella enterica subsp. enterica]|nr:hypothetical protein KCP73_16695 [Salmonella enterica subsp. enterica]
MGKRGVSLFLPLGWQGDIQRFTGYFSRPTGKVTQEGHGLIGVQDRAQNRFYPEQTLSSRANSHDERQEYQPVSAVMRRVATLAFLRQTSKRPSGASAWPVLPAQGLPIATTSAMILPVAGL